MTSRFGWDRSSRNLWAGVTDVFSLDRLEAPDDPAAAHCGAGMPAALIAAAKDSRSFRKTASLSSLESPPGTMPSLVSRSVISGDLASAMISLPIAATIGSGVPAGARKPFQDENSNPGSVSDTDGMSGAAASRRAVP